MTVTKKVFQVNVPQQRQAARRSWSERLVKHIINDKITQYCKRLTPKPLRAHASFFRFQKRKMTVKNLYTACAGIIGTAVSILGFVSFFRTIAFSVPAIYLTIVSAALSIVAFVFFAKFAGGGYDYAAQIVVAALFSVGCSFALHLAPRQSRTHLDTSTSTGRP
jgi:hypothetical protein